MEGTTMRKFLPLAAACALTLMVGSAHAAEVIGPIEHLDTTAKTIMVGGKIFAMSPTNTVGPKISEMKEGERVKIVYASQGKSYMKLNAMRVEKAAE
jgi:hypothetical protein